MDVSLGDVRTASLRHRYDIVRLYSPAVRMSKKNKASCARNAVLESATFGTGRGPVFLGTGRSAAVAIPMRLGIANHND